jgi:hypothetical protein
MFRSNKVYRSFYDYVNSLKITVSSCESILSKEISELDKILSILSSWAHEFNLGMRIYCDF